MRIIIAVFLLLNLSFVSQAQDFPASKFQSEKVTWLGIDFTLAKLVDELAFTDPSHIVTSYLGTWNRFVISEVKKYDVKKSFHKDDMSINLDIVSEYNKEIDPKTFVQNDSYTLESDKVVEDVKKYASSGLEGIGVIMYVESYNKNNVLGTYWLTLFDLSSGEVLFIEKLSTKPKGFGVRNYWAGTFYQALKSIDKSMKKWLN